MNLVKEMLLKRRTKIVATLGPASSDAATVERLIAAGMNVVRLNMSHGDHETHRLAYKEVRTAANDAGRPVGVLADLCGPKIRVGRFDGGRIELADGDEVTVTTRDVAGGPGLIPSQYQALADDVRPGRRILLSDGLLELRVDTVEGTEVSCTVVHGGELKDRKGINLPDSAMSTPTITDKDRADALFAVDLGVDFLALSFVRRAADVEELRSLLPEESTIKIIAKIERPEALEDIDAIIEASDGIMVARGDLGVELPLETVPVIQRELIARTRRAGKPTIVATQMLETMIEHPQPTRAEVSDVSTAVFSGADAVMLSAETASGRFPVRAVEMMDRVARQVEAHIWSEKGFHTDEDHDEIAGVGSQPLNEAIARSTAMLSRDLRARAIVVYSNTGATVRHVASARPAAPIVAATPFTETMLQMSLLWGTVPRKVEQAELDDPHGLARRLATELGLAEPGKDHRVLTVAGFRAEAGEIAPGVTVVTV